MTKCTGIAEVMGFKYCIGDLEYFKISVDIWTQCKFRLNQHVQLLFPSLSAFNSSSTDFVSGPTSGFSSGFETIC